ncbi:unannotated protein [freshwater metagenome]|uniref:Unannotated protein n=1 Tax=freshwater metagenome TaxID=449393 RepID=A0A6J7L499_9ZZZZ
MKLSAREIAFGRSLADAAPAFTMMGLSMAVRARAIDSSADSPEINGNTFAIGAAIGSLGSRSASISCADVASTSRARPFFPGLSFASCLSIVMEGSIAGRSMASDIPASWLVSAGSSTTTTGSTSRWPRRSAARVNGFHDRPEALSTVACASNARPASRGFTTNSLPAASSLNGLREAFPRVASSEATASAELSPPIVTPLTTEPCRTPPPESTMRAM